MRFTLILILCLGATVVYAQPSALDQWFRAGETLPATKLNKMVGRIIQLESDEIYNNERVRQLERKMAGVQKQVTILHSRTLGHGK